MNLIANKATFTLRQSSVFDHEKEKIKDFYNRLFNFIDNNEIDAYYLYFFVKTTKVIENGKKVILFHGINAGAPLTLEAVKELRKDYLLFAIDTIGQATKSDETVLGIKDKSYAIWAKEVLNELKIENVICIGISYGSFILQKLISHYPNVVSKCIFVVPSGLVNGTFLP